MSEITGSDILNFETKIGLFLTVIGFDVNTFDLAEVVESEDRVPLLMEKYNYNEKDANTINSFINDMAEATKQEKEEGFT